MMELYCKTIEGKPGWRELTKDFVYKDTTVPKGFKWNGSNPEVLTEGNWFQRALGRFINNYVPRFNGTLKSSCTHDFICKQAERMLPPVAIILRRKGDEYYKELSEMNRINTAIGYNGVKLGRFFKYGMF